MVEGEIQMTDKITEARERILKIPFLDEFKEKILDGRKTATSRTKIYGKAGQVFTAFDNLFILTHIIKMPIETVAYRFYREEGCDSPRDFMDVWFKIHRRLGYVKMSSEGREVYLHLFRKVSPLTGEHKTFSEGMKLGREEVIEELEKEIDKWFEQLILVNGHYIKNLLMTKGDWKELLEKIRKDAKE